jgi:hypothetical protein
MVELLTNTNYYDETLISCLECHYLYRPNPDEDHYMCLRTLEKILHELDDSVNCIEFVLLKAYWKPIYITELKNYI